MRAVILNGAFAAADPTDALATRLEARLAAKGAAVRHFILRDFAISPCQGQFDCWIRTPGRCRLPDEAQEIERGVHDCDLYVMVTPLSFGGYGSVLKRAADRLIPLILPFFERRAGMTHHARRYGALPRLVAIGVTDGPKPEERALFEAIAENNGVNLGARGWSGAVVDARHEIIDEALEALLDEERPCTNPDHDRSGARGHLQAMLEGAPAAGRPTRIAILNASVRRRGSSTSLVVAEYVGDLLQRAGCAVDIVPVTAFVRGGAHAEHAASVLADADALLVVSPLYVSALPAPAVLALETIAARARTRAHPQSVGAIINSGFPEPEHSRFAFGVMRTFATHTGGQFIGGVAVGGGEAINGKTLEQMGFLTHGLRGALKDFAIAIAQGTSMPAGRGIQEIAPGPIYRFAGEMGWHVRGKANDLGHASLLARPFDAMVDADRARLAAATPGRGRPLRVVEKNAETADAMTIAFEDPAHDPLTYEAGQHITLEAEIGGTRVRRAYSLASLPRDPGLAITVKRVTGGVMSNWLHDSLKVGDVIRAYGPSGEFVTAAGTQAKRHLLLVAGGAGIVPLAAIARSVLSDEPESQVTLISGAAYRDKAIFADVLERLRREHVGRFALHWVFEESADAGVLHGRLDEAGIGAVLNSLLLGEISQTMLCGPDAMRATVRDCLIGRGVLAETITEESFRTPRPDLSKFAP